MRVLMLSKACIVGIYQRKLEHLAALGVDLLVAVPPSWRDERGVTKLERVYTSGYDLVETPIWFNGNFHLHLYPANGNLIRTFQPDIVHIDEEPYNLATWHALWHARQHGAKTLFFSWQNLHRTYPPPFRWGERWVLGTVDYAVMGTQSAADVWRDKGYQGPLAVIPQFGTDPNLFQAAEQHPERPFTVGYVGRLVPEKGIDILMRAVALLPPDTHLKIIGSGPQRPHLEHLANTLGIQTTFIDWVASVDMPGHYRQLDALVLPSLTRPNWKEQFGRVLIEAMASGVPVVGSDSGAIPNVIADAGLVVPEGDVDALTAALQQLRQDTAFRTHLAARGEQRVHDHYTHAQIAGETYAVYQKMTLSDP